MKSDEKAASGEIAIIGMAGRFPAAQNVDALWNAVFERRDCLEDFRGGRTPALDHYFDLAGTPEGPPTRRGGFLADFDRFDAAFFQIAPREADWMDPQQRLLLEVAWEAIEDAGQTLETLKGSRTGVFVGIWTSDYELHANLNAPAIDFFSLTGGPLYAAGSRLSHQFDLRGPDITVNAASAASLVAIHLAVRSLRSGESSMALAGGVNMIFRDEPMRAFSRAGMLAHDGCCRFGAAGPGGIVRSEGVGVLVLRRLVDALRDGDPILGLILGTAMTNGGKSGGSLTTPSEIAQRATMLDALNDAGIEPASVQYVEAHGTGSRAGDPVELAAIASVFGGPKRLPPCGVGSVKSNIGHTESAAGVAGIIKMIQALRHRTLPATLLVEQPTQTIDWASAGIVLQTQTAPWNKPDSSPRRAAVNGLALMGTNAHVVLQEAPITSWPKSPVRTHYLLPISAASEAALRRRVQDVVAVFEAPGGDGDALLADICYTAAVRRSHLSHRIAVAGRNAAEIRDRLRDYLSGEEAKGWPIVEDSFIIGTPAPLSANSTGWKEPETESSLISFGRLYVSGSAVNWKRLYPFGNFVSLPSYPWQRERFWIDSRQTESASAKPLIVSSPESDVSSGQRGADRSSRDLNVGSLAEELKAMNARERRNALLSWLCRQTAMVLDSAVERIATDKPLRSQGLDSLMSMELLSRIERGLGLSLSPGTIWNYPEISTLAPYLSGRLVPTEETGEQTSGTNAADSERLRAPEPAAAELLERELADAEMILRGQVL